MELNHNSDKNSETLKQSKSAGLKGVVLKHKNNIFLDKNKVINFANKNKMFILVK